MMIPNGESRRCSVDGCSRGHYARSWCEPHYRRQRLTGGTGPVEIQQYARNGCSVDGCTEPHLSAGLCSKHHQRQRAHGDPTVFIGPQRAAFVKNPAVHWRLRQDFGPAAEHTCRHCEEPADQWAYDHGDREPLMDEEGPYSLDPARYMPLCFSCHTRFDKAAKVGAP
jgi:hypothetical protein